MVSPDDDQFLEILVQQRMALSLVFAENVCHISNNRGASVISGAQFLAKGAEGEQKEVLEEMLDSATTQNAYIRNMQTFVPQNKLESCLIYNMKSLFDFIFPSGSGMTLNLYVEGKPVDPKSSYEFIVKADAARLNQAFMGLFLNSYESYFVNGNQRSGSLNIDVSQKKGCEKDPPKVMISISDEGCGISNEDMQRIYEPGVTFGKKDGGIHTGYGLNIARYIIEKYGGSIDVQSDGVGKGTKVTVEMPLVLNDLKEE